ncbi:conserved domain protein [Blautia sp. CAG:237]|uniref:S1C family serine protease n=1 Tax=Blautia sp. CAG:237 TaxID=1262755 RepID=UPI000335C00F|nr:S1C family serine protease [Blautia sp. CAG:237]CDB77279.1 conserved domain protein [Blautia sp. CAG:237]
MRNDKKASSENYSFIKETIKEQPTDKKRLAGKFLTAAVCGVIFGACAAGTMALIVPKALEKFGTAPDQKAVVTLTPSVKAEQVTPTPEATEQEKTSASTAWQNDLSDGMSQIAEEPRRALVRISAAGEDSDLLDDSFLEYGDEEGFVFLKNSEAFYILTVSDQMQEADKFTVTFSDGTVTDGILCKKDLRTGFFVIKVPFTSVDEETQEKIPAAPLVAADDMKQTESVIAIGSPSGDYDSLMGGTITSVTGTLKVADEEYGMLTTDMVGSEEGGGILLNFSGEVAGIIWNQEEDRTNVIRAVETAQLRPLLESMANGEDICYIGIMGATISSYQSENLDVPRGVYVDAVDEDSPAMTAGIQNGDILHALDGQEVQSMEEYASVLQGLNKGTRTTVNVYRKNPFGEYEDVQLKVTIKEK